MSNPMIQQGTLNRVITSVVVPSFPSLNVTASYMSNNFSKLDIPGPYADLIGTGTGAVVSDAPYVIANLNINILRTQSLAALWIAQAQSESSLGQVTAYGDSRAFPAITLDNCVIDHVDPHAFDGRDPVLEVVIHGVFYANNDLWNL